MGIPGRRKLINTVCVVINFFINFHHRIIHSLSQILERNWENRLRFKIYPQSSAGNLFLARPGKIGQVTSLQMKRRGLPTPRLADGSWTTLTEMKEKMCKVMKKWWASSGEATGGEAVQTAG